MCACNRSDDGPQPETAGDHLRYFGFTIVDTYWDDPTDAEVKTNYADEIHTFSNLADILVISQTDDITDRVVAFDDLQLRAILHLNEVFFELTGTDSPSGADYDLRPDYEERWDAFVITNRSILTAGYIGAFYIGEEPTWNGISYAEMEAVAALLDGQYPDIPLMIIEAYPVLQQLQVPETVDWVGFDHYFIKDPNTDATYQDEWKVLRSKLTRPSQRTMVVMDTHYMEWAHGDWGGIALDEMGEVAENYYRLAQGDTTVVGVLGYFWPSGFDFAGSVGARDMPEYVRATYRRIGREITGK
ncbi:MAG: hypothetical protein WBH03_17050 [Cyclobacteriaceae bacterium]